MANWVYVKYLGGFANTRPKVTVNWSVLFERDQFVVSNDTGFLASRKTVRTEPWSKIRISLQDSGMVRGNLATIAAFGVLGLASRTPTTLLSVRYPDGDVYFELRRPYRLVRAEFARVVGNGSPAGDAITLGPLDAETEQPDQDVVGQLERLAALHNSGVLTAEEFQHKKAEMLKRL